MIYILNNFTSDFNIKLLQYKLISLFTLLNDDLFITKSTCVYPVIKWNERKIKQQYAGFRDKVLTNGEEYLQPCRACGPHLFCDVQPEDHFLHLYQAEFFFQDLIYKIKPYFQIIPNRIPSFGLNRHKIMTITVRIKFLNCKYLFFEMYFLYLYCYFTIRNIFNIWETVFIFFFIFFFLILLKLNSLNDKTYDII